jgi:hypothetical protein
LSFCKTKGTSIPERIPLWRIGTLSIDDNSKESRLNGVLLVVLRAGHRRVESDRDPAGDATAFLENHGFLNGDKADVTGTERKLGNETVIDMIKAEHVPAAAAPSEAFADRPQTAPRAIAVKAAAPAETPVTKKSAAAKARRPAVALRKVVAAKKAVTKKAVAKKAAAKNVVPKKAATKKSKAKKPASRKASKHRTTKR